MQLAPSIKKGAQWLLTTAVELSFVFDCLHSRLITPARLATLSGPAYSETSGITNQSKQVQTHFDPDSASPQNCTSTKKSFFKISYHLQNDRRVCTIYPDIFRCTRRQ